MSVCQSPSFICRNWGAGKPSKSCFNLSKLDKFLLCYQKSPEEHKGYYLFTELLKIIEEINCIVVIEGVETEAHVNSISEYKFCQLQGFYFSAGVPRKQFEELVKVQPFSL